MDITFTRALSERSILATNDPLKLEDVSRDGPFCLSPDALAAVSSRRVRFLGIYHGSLLV